MEVPFMAKAKQGSTKDVKSAEDFNAKYANIIINPEEVALKYGYWSTGSPRVDALLGGGLRKGTISEFYGKPQSGKSTLALCAAREVIRAGGRVLWIDLERNLDIRQKGVQGWLQKNGIDPHDTYHFQIVQDPEDGEQMYQMIVDSISNGIHQLVVLDSMAAVTTRGELAGDMGESHYGAVAKLNAQALKVLFHKFGKNRDSHIIIVNQVRDNMSSPIKGAVKSTGGRALEHYVGVKVRFDKIGRQEKPDDVLTAIKVKLDKSRFSPARSVEIQISSNRGVDVLQEVLEYAIEAGYIHVTGAWYNLYDQPVDFAALKREKREKDVEAGFVTALQGGDSAREYLMDSGWFDQLYAAAVGNAAEQALNIEDDD
jgi:recombination protein RecA